MPEVMTIWFFSLSENCNDLMLYVLFMTMFIVMKYVNFKCQKMLKKKSFQIFTEVPIDCFFSLHDMFYYILL